MNNIDYIYYAATSTDTTTGYITVVQAQYFVPFLDFLMLAIVFIFTILFLWFFRNIMIKNHYIIVKKTIIKKDKD